MKAKRIQVVRLLYNNERKLENDNPDESSTVFKNMSHGSKRRGLTIADTLFVFSLL